MRLRTNPCGDVHPSPMVVVAFHCRSTPSPCCSPRSVRTSPCAFSTRRARGTAPAHPRIPRPRSLVDAGGVTPSGPRTSRRPTIYLGTSRCPRGRQVAAPKGVLSPWSTIAAFAPFGADAFELDRDSAWAEISHLSYDMAMTNLLVACGAAQRSTYLPLLVTGSGRCGSSNGCRRHTSGWPHVR